MPLSRLRHGFESRWGHYRLQSGQFPRHHSRDELVDRSHRLKAEAAAPVSHLGRERQPVGEQLANDLPGLRHLPTEHAAPLSHCAPQTPVQRRVERHRGPLEPLQAAREGHALALLRLDGLDQRWQVAPRTPPRRSAVRARPRPP